jgi:phage major head subunit gpT-like protein
MPDPIHITLSATPQWLEAKEAAGPARFTMLAYTGGPMRVAGWSIPVVVDLAGLRIPNQQRPIRLQHDVAQGVGHTDTITVADGKLHATGIVSRDTPAARDVVTSGRNGFPWQASIGASVEKVERIPPDATATVNGATHQGPVAVIRQSSLSEISFVDLGADDNTSARIAAEQKEEKQVETKHEDTQDTDAPLAAVKAERARREAIVALGPLYAKRFRDLDALERIISEALTSGITAEQCELKIFRAMQASVPDTRHTTEPDVSPDVVEAGVLIGAGMDGPRFSAGKKADAFEQARARWRSGLSLQEILGLRYQGNIRGNIREALRAAFAPPSEVHGAFSTIDISGILGNVANKAVREAFEAVDNSWRGISAIKPVKDFKTNTTYSLTGDLKYKKVAPGGQIEHATLGETSYTNKADTYARMLAITRQDIINDDLGALTAVPRRLGRGAALQLNHIFWTEFMDNSTFFTDARGNYIEGTTTTLTLVGLNLGAVAFGALTDPDGNVMGTMPKILLVPMALDFAANQLMKSNNVSTDAAWNSTTGAQFGTANPFAGRFNVVVSPYLSVASYTGYSATAWYLLADPRDVAVIETCFLDGKDVPTIENAEADFDSLGIQMRGYYDFGVTLQEYRGGVMSKGAAS